jgi:hypothetical protein
MPCCSNDLVESVIASFLIFALPQTATLLNDKSGVASVPVWPLVDRAAFLLAAGVSRTSLLEHLDRKQYPPEVLNTSTGRLLSAAAGKIGFEPVESVARARQTRLGLCSTASRIYDWAAVGSTGELPQACERLAPRGARPLAGGAHQPVQEVRSRRRIGDVSVTILRHPFQRAVSAAMYKGHSPNYDVFGLRPGFWLHPADKPPGYRSFNFHDYVRADEYQNNLVKLFGDSRGK